MKLHLRLAIPLLVISVVVTAAVTLGMIALVRGTVDVVFEQSGAQLERITRNALRARMENLDEVASVFAALRGDISARDREWKHVPLDAAAVLDSRTGKVRSAMGLALNADDLKGLLGSATGDPRVMRAGSGLAIAGVARDDSRRETVVVAQTLGDGFAAELKDLLQAEIEIAVGGVAVAGGRAGPATAEPRYPVRSVLPTPGGAEVTVTMAMPAGAVYATRRKALAFTVAGGVVLLAIAFLFYGYAVVRVTRPVRDLIRAAERIAAGDLSAELKAGAPAELGTLVREFNQMARSLKDMQEKLVHSAQLSSVGQLVAGISHELNNPLLGLLGHAEHLASKTRDDDPAKEKLATIIREAQRMKRTLADLKSFTRPGGKERVRVNLNQLSDEVLGLVRHDAAKAGVKATSSLAAGGAAVAGVPDRLRQVLLNLVLNALQAMPDGGKLVVRTAARGGRMEVAVEDTGPGIPDGVRERVLDPFFSTRPGRMGLGLSISREIVEEHGGALRIEARPGGGTAVRFDLPADGG